MTGTNLAIDRIYYPAGLRAALDQLAAARNLTRHDLIVALLGEAIEKGPTDER